MKYLISNTTQPVRDFKDAYFLIDTLILALPFSVICGAIQKYEMI